MGSQLSLFTGRLDGESTDPSDYQGISEEDDAYYNSNSTYLAARNHLVNAMDGTE